MTTSTIYRSKIGLGILIPLVFVLGTVTAIMVVNLIWPGVVVCGLVILFVTNIYIGTYYQITTDQRLFIRCGVLKSFNIDIQEIESVKRTNELTNAPALSIDRIEIRYKGGCVLISPRDQKKLVEDLKKVNSKIWWAGESLSSQQH
jgi:hypothetical protein